MSDNKQQQTPITYADLFKQDDFRQQYALARRIGDKRFGSACTHKDVKGGHCTQCLRKVMAK
jgi:hypothetical protein